MRPIDWSYAALMVGRPMTLAPIQTLLTRAVDAGGGIPEIVRGERDAQAQHRGAVHP